MKVEDINEMLDALVSVEKREARKTHDQHVIHWLDQFRPKYLDKLDQPSLIPKLEDWLSQHDADPHAVKLPYYRLFLAYSQYLNNQKDPAVVSARISEREFLNRGKHLQAAISSWFTSSLWCELEKFEAASEKFFAIDLIFLRRQHASFEYGHYDTHDAELKEKILAFYQKEFDQYETAQREKEANQTDTTSAINDAEKIKVKVDKPKPTETVVTKPVIENANIFYLTIPLTERALENPDLLKQYKAVMDKQRASKPNPAAQIVAAANPTPPQQNLRLLIPALPLYGPVAAGPGQPFLQPTGETISQVDASLMIKIHGRDYHVSSIGNRVRYQFGENDGWLMVVGESMNAATGIPIEHNDYVLFQEIADPTPYEKKIVIGEQVDYETQPPQVVVKRLIKSGNKFYLHSESSLNDPLYKKDIEITRNNQIKAIVIAVAKPV